MAHLRIQHSLQGSSNLPEDRFINVFHVRSEAVMTTAHLDDVCDFIAGFYSDVPSGQSDTVAHYMNSGADASGRSVKIYDMADAIPRSPIRTSAPVVTAFNSTTDNLPEELAVCLSYKAAGGSGHPAARTRGRIYVGPLTLNAMTSGSNLVQASPNNAFRDLLLAAGSQLQSDLNGIGYQWCVWSPTDAILHTIVQVSVDNAWDVQRRRGHAPSLRSVLAV